MLVAMKRWLIGHQQAISRHHLQWRQTPVVTLLTMLVLAVVLLLPLLLWMVTGTLQQWMNGFTTQQTIDCYLKPELTLAEAQTVLETITTIDGVQRAELISPEQGLARLQDPSLMESLAALPDNPLPAMLEILPQPTLNTPHKLASLLALLKQQPAVELVQLDMQWVVQLASILQFARTMTYALTVLLALAAVLIIGNTLSLVVHQQRQELQVLHLVGASPAFMIRPFLYAGLGYGLGGGLIALGLLRLFFYVLQNSLQQLFSAYQLPYHGVPISWFEISVFLLSALMLGWLAASLAVNRQLAAIEPSSI